MSFDLTELNTVELANKGAVINIVHPSTGDDLGMKITVAGSDSDLYRKAQRKIMNKRLAEKKMKTRVEEIENESLELLAQCTMSWEGVKEGGMDILCTPENAKRLYKTYPWLKEQVDTAITDRGLYLGN